MFFNVLFVFLWKNCKRLINNWKTTLLYIAIPIALISYLMNLMYTDFQNSQMRKRLRESEGIEIRDNVLTRPSDYSNINYYPDTPEWKTIMDNLKNQSLKSKLYWRDKINVTGFKTKEILYNHLNTSDTDYLSAILFDETTVKDDNKKNNYFIRLSHPYRRYYDNDKKHRIYRKTSFDSYAENGFLNVQYNVEKSYLQLKLNGKLPEIAMSEIETEPLENFNRYMLDIVAPLILATILTINLSMVLLPMVEEKQDGIKEILDIATTHSYLNHVAIFIIGFCVCAFILIVVLIQGIGIYDIFNCASVIYPIILLILFIFCMLSLTFFVSTFFDTVTFAPLVGSLFYLIPYVLLLLQTDIGPKLKFLSPLVLYNNGMDIINSFLKINICFDGEFVNSHEQPVENYSLLDIYLSLLFTGIFYLCAYYYLSNVFPGRRGTPKPFYFLFTRAHWFRKRSNESQTPTSFVQQPTTAQGTKAIVHVKNLWKTFQKIPFCGSTFTAVREVNFVLPENRITILLGHNGAGKTTTMSMITGILPPSQGDIIVDGECDVSVYRSTIGYCPQNDVFISYLNGRDHLIFFGRLRGLTKKEATEEANKLLEKVNLIDSATKEAKQLSSGMKRRLCLACAVIGETKLVILDEPSTGLDPESRRDLWDVLLPLRKERTILLTTHSMEEADVLGDKIIIMDHGKVVCEGTQLALKRQYGSGYTLKVMMNNLFNNTRTMEVIKSFIPNAMVKSKVYPTLQITLPYGSIQNFSRLLKKLEQNSKELGIDTISMTNTTMEEVFLNSASEKLVPQNDDDDNHENGENVSIPMGQSRVTKSSMDIYLNQFMAICYKKMIYLKKSWLRFLINVALPILAILACYLIVVFDENSRNRSATSTVNKGTFDLTAPHIPDQQIMFVINRSLTDYDLTVDAVKHLANDWHIKPIIKSDITMKMALKEMGTESLENLNYKLMGAVELKKDMDSIEILYQDKIAYSSSYMLNFVTNLLLKMKFSGDSLVVNNWPLDGNFEAYTNTKQSESPQNSSLYMIFLPNFLPFGLFFYIIFYLNLPFKEESTEFRIIQNVPSIHFWMTTYLADCILHTVIALIITLIALAFDTNNKIPNESFIVIFGVICIYGYVYLPLMYLFTKLFKTLSTIYSLLFFTVFGGMIGSVAFATDTALADYPIWAFFVRLLPEFHIRFEMNSEISASDHSMQAYFVYTIIEIVLFFAIVIGVFENIYVFTWFQNFFAAINPLRFCCCRKKDESSNNAVISDPNVGIETSIVDGILRSGNNTDYSLIVSKLEKYFVKFHAVKGVNFTVKKGECFGLLGMNGAGKSSIFKMLTLNTSVSKGDIFINGIHCKQENSYMKQFGYCPEMSALLDFMTGYEQLKYMAWVKGTSYSNLDSEVNRWLAKMDLKDFKNVIIEGFSGGTKRKLNTAISMISDPFLIFLDEPTSGVDPVSRRFMWRCIKQFQTELKTIVLTSHSMDECEELCNRLAIMVFGQFRTIGYIQKLKETYGTGFTLVIKLHEFVKPQEVVQIKEGILKLYECKLRDDYADTLTFNVLDNNIEWSLAFSKIQEFCGQHQKAIDDFAITEISLEDIFLQFRADDANAAAAQSSTQNPV